MANKVAVVQKPPVMLDRAATIALVVKTIGEVAKEGAALAVFPEAYVPGYPAWVWRLQRRRRETCWSMCIFRGWRRRGCWQWW